MKKKTNKQKKKQKTKTKKAKKKLITYANYIFTFSQFSKHLRSTV